MEIAEFIALMREQEAADDEEEYWLTHPVARFKRRLWSKIRGVDPRATAIMVRGCSWFSNHHNVVMLVFPSRLT